MERKSPYLFTFIVAYRHRTDRIFNLKRVLDWILGFNGVEVIIVEQDDAPRLHAFTLRGFKHIFVKSDLPFNKANAFNVGLKAASSDVVVFGDSDLIMNPTAFIDSLKKLEEFEAVSPYNRVIDLEQNEVNMSIEQMMMIPRSGRGEFDHQKVPLCGGIIMFRKEAIHRIGGWCEDFIGWGGEDDFQSIKTKRFLRWSELDSKVFHLWHHRGSPDMKWYQRNLQLLQKLSELSEHDLMKHIQNSISKIGFKNKFDK